MPFSSSEADAIESQALRAIVSTNSPFSLFEDPEMFTLFRMLRSRAPDLIPSAKVIGGRLLNEAAATVEDKLSKILKGQVFGAYTIYRVYNLFYFSLISHGSNVFISSLSFAPS